MNNYPNNNPNNPNNRNNPNGQGGNRVSPRNGGGQRPVGQPSPEQGRPRNGQVPRPMPPRNGQQPRPAMPPQDPRRRQPPPQQSRRNTRDVGRLGRIAILWVAVLLVILLIIFITSALRGDDNGGTKPTIGTTLGTTTAETTTEATTTYPVEYADYTDATAAFAGDYSFANGILIDLENNTVVASRGGDSIIYPASMTKVMTLIVAAEAVEDLDETFTMTAEITDPLYIANASVAGFAIGEEVTVRDLIYGLILPSGGDGALGLAYHIAGSEAAFADMMNEKAAELGLKKTHFTNPTGLHNDNHYSTCHEMALIVKYAIQDEFMRQVLTTYQYTTESTPEHPEGILLTSTLLSRMSGDESETMFVQGGKTGFTTEAKNCLASFATPLIPGMSEDELKLQPTKYILVTAGSGEKFGPVFDAIGVYNDFSGAEGPAVTAGVAVDPDDDVPADTGDGNKTDKPAASDTEKSEPVKIYTAAPPTQ